MEPRSTGDHQQRSHSLNAHFISPSLEQIKTELKAIARRHGFKAFEEELINSIDNLKPTRANGFSTSKTIDSDLNGFQRKDIHKDDDHIHDHRFCYLCSVHQPQYESTMPRDEYKKNKPIPYKNPKALLPSSPSDRKKQDSSSPLNSIPYRFIIRTGTQINSGTQAQVFLYLYGTENDWTSIHLQPNVKKNPSTDGFPSGSIRTFCFKGPDIGELHHLNVNLVGSRSDKEWFLKEIEITNLNTSTTWLCEFNCWLPKPDVGENHHVTPNMNYQTKQLLSVYILQIHTGEKSPVGQRMENMHIRIHGSANHTKPLGLVNEQVRLFAINQLDTFAIVGPDLGDLLEITIESMDKNEMTKAWHIKDMILWKILPNDDQKQRHFYFPFNVSLDKKLNKFKTNPETYSLTDHHQKGPICYQIVIKTGNVKKIGTDANVYLVIFGKNARTSFHHLKLESKTELGRNSTSEFMIMDIDVGKIDRIKLWHNDAHLGSAWFLESVLVRKTYSTCHVISKIYVQRLEQISSALLRQIRDDLNKHTNVRSSLKTENDRQSATVKDVDHNKLHGRSGSSRSSLRSPTVNDRTNLRKKVTWDEQSIGSQDDTTLLEAHQRKRMSTGNDQNSSFHCEMDHKIYWISSHNYVDHKWKISSIEETNSFDLDSSARSLLLSDRSLTNNRARTSANTDDKDEIYEFQANCWLKHDTKHDKTEVYLTPKSIHNLSSSPPDGYHDTERNYHLLSDEHVNVPHGKHANIRPASSHSVDPRLMEQSPRSSNLHNLQPLSSSQLLHTSKVQSNKASSLYDNAKLPVHSNTMLKKRDILQESHPPLEESLRAALSTPHPKSPRNMDNLTYAPSSEMELLSRLTAGSSSYPIRPTSNTSLSSLNQRPKLPLYPNDHTTRMSHEHMTSMQLSSSFRSPDTLLSSSNEYMKSPDTNNQQNRKHLTKLESSPTGNLRDQSNYSRSSATSFSLANQISRPSHSNNHFPDSSPKTHELSTHITNQSSSLLHSQSNLFLASNRQTHNLKNSSLNKRETLIKSPAMPMMSTQSKMPSLLSSNSISKSLSNIDEPLHSLKKTSADSLSNSNTATSKSIYNQVYQSAYGTSQLDDF